MMKKDTHMKTTNFAEMSTEVTQLLYLEKKNLYNVKVYSKFAAIDKEWQQFHYSLG